MVCLQNDGVSALRRSGLAVHLRLVGRAAYVRRGWLRGLECQPTRLDRCGQRHFYAVLVLKNDQFTNTCTGSGQTQGKLEKRVAFSCTGRGQAFCEALFADWGTYAGEAAQFLQ